jgi:hypothetical protein
LICYRPWVGDYDVAGGGVDSTTNQVVNEWENFALSFAEQGITPPHKMQETINQIREWMIVLMKNIKTKLVSLMMVEEGL